MATLWTIDRVLRDPNLLGAALGDAGPWKTWLAVLRAAFGLPLDEAEAVSFRQVAGDRAPPGRRVRELWAVVGRRGGKSRMAAALAVYAACFVPHRLSAGEVGHVLTLAASRDQAKVVFAYIQAFLEQSPLLRQEIENVTQTDIRLKSGVVLGTHANSFRSVRGRTLVAAIFDEVALWRDEASATPDVEVYRAVLPALMTTGGMLIGISTPYRKIGLLHQKHRDHFGVEGDDVLVVQGPSTAFNPQLSQEDVDAAVADDPEGARPEWEAIFRSDLAAFLDDETIDRAIDHGRPLELVRRHDGKSRYRAFVDPSGGRHDAFALCVGHSIGYGQEKTFTCDVVRARRPPFDPQDVVAEYAAVLKQFGLNSISGDRYSAEWVASAFGEHGVKYEAAEKSKSDLYLEALPLFTRGAISIPNYAPLIRELRLLERQAHRGGRDTVDHPRRGSDDLANALCGCAALSSKGGFDTSYAWIDGGTPRDWRETQRDQLWAHIMRQVR
jgi:hypothetical protein